MFLLAQAVAIGGYSLIHLIIFAVVLAGIIGIALVAARQAGVAIPQWVMTMFWIVVAVVVAVFLIKFLASLL